MLQWDKLNLANPLESDISFLEIISKFFSVFKLIILVASFSDKGAVIIYISLLIKSINISFIQLLHSNIFSKIFE